jgi:hypothetical protein
MVCRDRHEHAGAAAEVTTRRRTCSRRAYRAICDIPLDFSKEELDRRLRVFSGQHWGMSPSVNLHAVEFRAVVR